MLDQSGSDQSGSEPVPSEGYNPSEMFALHSIVEVAHALNYQLTRLYGTPGG